MPECKRNDGWNGYFCAAEDIVNLNFYSVAPDMKKRMFSPVTFENEHFTSVVNSLKEWEWHGPEPLNRRHSEFITIAKLFTTIKVSNAG